MYIRNIDFLVGATVKKVFMNKDNLRFDTDKGPICFRLDADCCSSSYFYDFYGVKNLLKNKKVIEVKGVPLSGASVEGAGDVGGDYIRSYGYQITTESEKWGKMTSVFSFRNYSNGYYGGSLEDCDEIEVSPELKDDVIEVKG